MKRFDDWPERLAAYLEASRDREKEWGVFDCALFTAGAIEAMTGIDLARTLRGKYSGQVTAAKAVKKFAGGGLLELARKLSKEFDCPEIEPGLAQRGDAVLIRDEGGVLALGVIDVRGFAAVTVSLEGLAYRDRGTIVRAWRV